MDSATPPLSSDSSADGQGANTRREEAIDRFVAFWGTMASNWGINPTMAKVYALLYCVEEPLNTDDIMERLEISRGSANMNLRSLLDWELVEKTHVDGSRKDHYVAEKDVWQVTTRIIEERERQEVRPVRERLQGIADHLLPEDERLDERPEAEQHLHRRIQNLIDLIDVFEGVTDGLLPLVRNQRETLIRQLISAAQSLGGEADGNEAPPSATN